MEDTTLYDWLVVIFMHEVPGSQLTDQNNMRAAIEAAGAGGNIIVFLIRDAIVQVDGDQLSFVLKVEKLEQKAGDGTWSFEPVTSKHLEIRNPDKHCWEHAFKYIYKNYFGERNLLITFSDGQAFGFNFDPTVDNRPNEAVQEAAPNAAVRDNRPNEAVQEDRPNAAVREAVPNEVLPEAFASVKTRDTLKTNYAQYYYLDQAQVDYLKVKDPERAKGIIPFTSGGAIKKNAVQDYCKNLEILWVSDLARALKEYIPSTIDVFIMCNCYMQLFDNGYLLSEKVKFLVAAEGYMSADCYDFGKMMKRLVYCPEVPSEILIKGIVHDLWEKYNNGNGKYADALAESSIYANRLKFYALSLQVFINLVADLIALLDKSPDQTCQQLQGIREGLDNVTGSGPDLIDAENWVDLVCTQINGLKNGGYYQTQFRTLRAKIVLAKLAQKVDANGKPLTTGISIFYPKVRPSAAGGGVDYCAYFDSAVPAAFNKELMWNVFLEKYFDALAKLPPAGGPTGGNGGTSVTIEVAVSQG